jgi:beta-phosphoglucomutase
MIESLIFDLDGVITHASAEYHYQSWQRLADEEGIPFSREHNEQLRGVPRDVSLQRFLAGRTINSAQAQDYMARKQAYYLEQLATMTPADRLPGVSNLLDAAKAAGLPMGVASASRNAQAVLEKLYLLHYFMIVGSAAYVGNPKPAPDLFLWVAGYLRTPVTKTLIFEDAAEGVAVARQAGFWTVGIGGIQNAHLNVHNLQDVTLNNVLQQLKSLEVG